VILCAVYGFRLQHSSPFVRKMQQVHAMLIKHILHSWRNLLMSLCQILTPVCFAVIACLIINTMPVITDPPPFTLTLEHFPVIKVPYSAGSDLKYLENCYVDAIKEQVGIGLRCVELLHVVSFVAWISHFSTLTHALLPHTAFCNMEIYLSYLNSLSE